MLSVDELRRHGLAPAEAERVASASMALADPTDAAETWRRIAETVLRPDHPFEVHRRVRDRVYADWDERRGPAPLWLPPPRPSRTANLSALMSQQGLTDYAELHRWSATRREAYWSAAIGRLGIRFHTNPARVLEPGADPRAARWLVGARLNIAESCFHAEPAAPAIVCGWPSGRRELMSIQQLRGLSSRVAHGLLDAGFAPGDAIAVDMPMTPPSVAIYLGIVLMGGVVVSIADSFAAPEIATRLRIAGARAMFTCRQVLRGARPMPLYEKVVAAGAPPTVVLDDGQEGTPPLRPGDRRWEDFLSDDDRFDPRPAGPDEPINILFSSGTTGEPKAIPWSHATAIQGAADGHFHQDIQPGDVVAWPTNLGWMMGPWLIFATLVNRATIALYPDAPVDRDFGLFVQDAGVTMLGLVPSLVRRWRQSDCMRGLDWHRIRAFSSTGECSNAEDMFYLMHLAGYRPVIEYCGGTEIGGGYITNTVVQPNAPSIFSTPALGCEVLILDEHGQPSDTGELFLVPPSIGWSTRLLNRDHDTVYYEGVPRAPDGRLLRRHGDQFEALPGGCFRALGRADDTMNLGGIKVSSAEIERAVHDVEGVRETAAIAVPPPGGGPSRLVVFAVCQPGATADAAELRERMQAAIRDRLNPLFRIHEVVPVDALPRTASQKVMRRELRAHYEQAPR